MDPCVQSEKIESIETNQVQTDKKVDLIIENQKTSQKTMERSQKTMEKYFGRLEDILVADIEHKKDIERLIDTVVEMKENQKEVNQLLFDKSRGMAETVQELNQFKAICDETNIKGRVSDLWDDKQAHRGFRKHRTDIYAAVGFIVLVINFFWDKIEIIKKTGGQ